MGLIETAVESRINHWLKEHELFDGTTLKLIAAVAMIFDHIAMTLLVRSGQVSWLADIDFVRLDFCYRVFRALGRLSFPVFAFLLVEGMKHTSDERRYLTRLLVFALLSELPFDLAVDGRLGLSHQNVFFTLALGAFMIALMKRFGYEWQLVIVLCAAMAAYVCHFDYNAYGILLLAVFWWFSNNRIRSVSLGFLLFLEEPYSVLGFATLLFYNGKRGAGLRYFFYLFYPLHLLALYFLWHGI